MHIYDIVIIDDHPIIAMVISKILTGRFGIKEIEHFTDPLEALKNLKAKKSPVVVILDLNLPNLNGLDFLRTLLTNKSDLFSVLIYTSSDDLMSEALSIRYGAKGFVSKAQDTSNLLTAVDALISGRTNFKKEAVQLALSEQSSPSEEKINRLSNRELQIASRLVAGESNSQIAEALSLSVKTISSHKTNLYLKLNISNIADLTKILKLHKS